MRRRLKNEMAQDKSRPVTDKSGQHQFDSTVVKLADMAKGRARLSDFTYNDRTMLLDLFVNNETVLMRLYTEMFPMQSVSLKQKNSLAQPSDKIELDPHKSLTVDTSARYLLQESSKAQLKEKFMS